MDGETMYRRFEQELKAAIPGNEQKLALSYEPTVTPGLFLAKVALLNSPGKALVKTDVRPEGVRMHFPVQWGDELAEWLGSPPGEAYRLKSNWVNQPSIGVAGPDFEPYFIQLSAKIIAMLKERLEL